MRRISALLLVVLALGSGCGSRPIIVATEGFLPAGPMVRSFAYSRVAPDGSTLLGTLTMAVAEAQEAGVAPRGATRALQTLVRFRADAKVFSPEQARLIDPVFSWPASAGEYPLDVSDIREDYIYRAVPAPSAAGAAADVAVFWVQGIYELLGMPQRPTHFRTAVSSRRDGSDALHLSGRFVRHGKGLGRYTFTFRGGHGLSSVSAVLADGTVITLVEREAPAGDVPPAPAEPLWVTSVTRM